MGIFLSVKYSATDSTASRKNLSHKQLTATTFPHRAAVSHGSKTGLKLVLQSRIVLLQTPLLSRSSEAVSELTASARGRLLTGLPSSAPRDADSSTSAPLRPAASSTFLTARFCWASAWEGLKLLNPNAWNQRAYDLTCRTRRQAVKCLASTVSFACECCAWGVQKGLSEPWGRAVVWLMTLSSLPFHSGDEHIGNALINVDYRIKSSSPFKSGL